MERNWSHLGERVILAGANARRGVPGVCNPRSDPRRGGEQVVGSLWVSVSGVFPLV